MTRFLSIIPAVVLALLAHAADDQAPADVTTVTSSDVIRIVIFLVIFFGLIVGYFAWMYWGKKKDKDDDKG